ncbi:hypothetical protein ILYODFUR_029162 [Ilyodon furcidens]|uniref:Uncharacterized protein n=1 Tax=Ilyodon furcidens TaxID=33524 RepID=A0ABV0U2V3_9TELE
MFLAEEGLWQARQQPKLQPAGLTIKFNLTEYSTPERKFHYSRSLSDDAVTTFKESVPLLISSLSQKNTMEGNNFVSSSSQIVSLVHSVSSSLRDTLDNAAPLKKKVIIHRRLPGLIQSCVL